MKSAYVDFEIRRETAHSVGLLAPLLREDDRLLDVGCGTAHVAFALEGRRNGTALPRLRSIVAVDIADIRRCPTPSFCLYDGVDLPFPDDAFDVVLIGFVLHHLPNADKPRLLAEARRVARRDLLVLEDTPSTVLDAWLLGRHGRSYRAKIGSEAAFGFYTRDQWARLFASAGLSVRSASPVPRLARGWSAPWSRTAFVLSKA